MFFYSSNEKGKKSKFWTRFWTILIQKLIDTIYLIYIFNSKKNGINYLWLIICSINILQLYKIFFIKFSARINYSIVRVVSKWKENRTWDLLNSNSYVPPTEQQWIIVFESESDSVRRSRFEKKIEFHKICQSFFHNTHLAQKWANLIKQSLYNCQ